MKIPDAVVRIVWERLEARGLVSLREFPDGKVEAIDLCGGPGRGYVLRPDGSIWAWDLEFEGHQAVDDREATRAICIAVQRIPELRSALLDRGPTATECEGCGGHGFVDLGDHPRWLVCVSCDGLGWREFPDQPVPSN